jgi:hypothetical protein
LAFCQPQAVKSYSVITSIGYHPVSENTSPRAYRGSNPAHCNNLI